LRLQQQRKKQNKQNKNDNKKQNSEDRGIEIGYSEQQEDYESPLKRKEKKNTKEQETEIAR
jgi:hypothetical protein